MVSNQFTPEMIGPVRRSDPFWDIVVSYKRQQLDSHRPRFPDVSAIAEAVCPYGRPLLQYNGRNVSWHTGLGSFCDEASLGVIGELAEQHADANHRLYEVWCDLEDSDLVQPMYRDKGEPIGDALRRGVYLVPSLSIANRELLSDHYVEAILRPYAQAQYALRKKFFEAIAASHRRNEWIGFRPTEAGRYVLTLPPSGFDGRGTYSIDRKTYLGGLGYAEDEIGKENFPHRAPYPDQDKWIFIGAEIVQDLGLEQLVENEAEPKIRRGRPKGSGFDEMDAKYVEEGVCMVRNNEAANAHQAAWILIERYCEDIPGQGTEDSKQSRLRKRISAALRKSGS
jgi:hypothetical protein